MIQPQKVKYEDVPRLHCIVCQLLFQMASHIVVHSSIVLDEKRVDTLGSILENSIGKHFEPYLVAEEKNPEEKSMIMSHKEQPIMKSKPLAVVFSPSQPIVFEVFRRGEVQEQFAK
jgi:hypothetical protein